MNSDDSFNDSDEIFNLYSSKKVSETFKSNLQKLVSKKECSGDGEHSEGLLNNVNSYNEKPNNSIIVDEELSPISNKKARTTEVSEPSISGNKEPSLEDSLDTIEILNEQAATSKTRKSARLRKKRGEIRDLNDSLTFSQEHVSECRKKSSNVAKKNKKETKNVKVEEIVLDDSLNFLESLQEDEINPEVSVKVIWKSVVVKKFKIRKFQKMSTIFEQLSREENVPIDKVVLTFNNIKVSQNDTPDSLKLQIFHFIDGGVLSESTNSCEPSDTHMVATDNSITLKFQGVANKIVKVVLGKNEKMKIGMIKYSEQVEVPLKKIKFYFDGESLDPSETPTSLELEGDEIIDVKILS